ncbi:DJ-1/PfpI family protein [Vibrio mediterranei]|uniref:Glutamine amidotransferase n=1 Tax=Vibrio mediterranei TaxID=689 RepID=A0AAN1FIE7_9VIBR|nr:DJ-1/PfpI family protein [Vibrio mediterranei]ASI90877.1 glutamine amidotransferase [Vibrio mediterranei]
MNVGIYVYRDVEVLDFAGPFEVFSTANRFLNEEDKWSVSLLSQTQGTVLARGGLKIQSDYSIYSHPAIDVLIVPGGVHIQEVENTRVLDWVRETAANSTLVASVCTGAFLLAKSGVLSNQTVTTHWEDQNELQHLFPELTIINDTRWVDCGDIVTSAGISAGIDMSLRLVEKLRGRDIALKTAKQMEFDWCEHGVTL